MSLGANIRETGSLTAGSGMAKMRKNAVQATGTPKIFAGAIYLRTLNLRERRREGNSSGRDRNEEEE
jgi:hypothetical protein